MEVATLATAADGRIRSVSPAFLELVGRSVDELASITVIDLVHPHDAARARDLLGDAGRAGFDPNARLRLHRGDSWVSVEVGVRTADDGRRILEFSTGATAKPATPPAVSPTPVSPAAVAPLPEVPEMSASTGARMPSRLAGFGETVRTLAVEYGGRRELLAAAAVVVFAFVVRAWDLVSLPTGLHGDEGITGLEAIRILNEGSIGPYTGSALGQPTGPFYLHAISVGLFGETIWAIRIVSALAGAVTVALLYRIVARRFDHRIALASALALAMMTWSIHFSRIAFGVAWWPLVVLLAVAAIDNAAREQTGRAWFIAGAASVLGLYVYNSHWGFGPAVVLFVAAWIGLRLVTRRSVRFDALAFGVLGALVVAYPMGRYILDHEGFFNHFDQVSRRRSPEWTEAGALTRLRLHVGWYVDVWRSLFWRPIFDGADASGINRPVPGLFGLAAAAGLVELLRRHRTAFVAMMLATMVTLPITTSLTFDAVNRRSYALSPFVAILVGIGAVALLDLGVRYAPSLAQNEGFGPKQARRAGTAVLVVLGFVVGVVPYFTTFRQDDGQIGVFAAELTIAADAVDRASQDRPVHVNWYSPRHDYLYPTIEFLLPDTPGETRAPIGQGFVPGLELGPSDEAPGADQVFVMIGPYADELDRLMTTNPGGRVIADETRPRIVVYEVPGAG